MLVNVVNPVPKLTDCNPVQKLKAPSWATETFGKSIVFNPVQLLNALVLIVITLGIYV